MSVQTASPRRSVKDRVRIFNKYVTNPLMLRVAGKRFAYSSVLLHVGRRSGKAYATPVVAAEIPGGFVVPLPYGTAVDWLRNVLAAGVGVLEHKGDGYDLNDPQVVPFEQVEPLLDRRLARLWKRFGIREFLRVTARKAPEQ